MRNSRNSIERYIHGGMLILKESTPAFEAARAMYSKRVGSVVVYDRFGKIAGLLTDRDLSMQVLAFGYPPQTPIGELMTLDVYKINENETVEDAVSIMEAYGVRRVPVVSGLGTSREKCIGMVTLDDLIADKALEIDTLSRIVSQQVLRPSRRNLREEHRREHLEQTLNRFYSVLSRNMKLDADTTERVTYYLLSTIIRRLPPTGAAQLLSQLPKLLQEELLELPAGPDKEITAGKMLSDMHALFGFSKPQAHAKMECFWDGLEDFTHESGEPEQALAQLPKDIRALLG